MRNVEVFSFDENKFDNMVNSLVSMTTSEKDIDIVSMDLEMIFDHCFKDCSFDMHNDFINL